MMPDTATPPAHDRWHDVDGTHISLFSRVEQATECPQPGVLPSRLHQHGQVVGRSLDSLYVRFEDNAIVSLPPHLLRRLPDSPASADAPITAAAQPTPAETPTLRIGARVLLLDQHDHVLLIHAQDPDEPDQHWWELPGGGADPGKDLPDTARRELAEETGILLDHLGPHLWDRETRFRYRGQQHHRCETVYLARVTDTAPTLRPRHTANEKAGLLGHRWWSEPELATCTDKLLPPNLPALLADALAGQLHQPVVLHD